MMRGATPWIITRKHPPAVGGMEELSFRVAQQLAARRPITVVRWGRSQVGLPFFACYAALRLLGGLVTRRVAVLVLGDPVLAVLGALARGFGVPVLIVVHGLDVLWHNAAYQAYLRRFFWGRCDAYFCISRYTAALVRAQDVPDSAIIVIPVGVTAPPPAAPAPVEGDPVLLFVGRLVPRKGAAWFVQAVLPELVVRLPSVKVLIAGDGPERALIERAARDARVAGHVELLGAVSDTSKWSLFARCDLVIMPNVPITGDPEGFGIVALEASAAGKPVMAADLEGLRDAVTDGENGWRVPPREVRAWIDALVAQLDDRAALAAMGERARAHVTAHFGWDTIGERYAAAIERYVTAR